VTLDFRKEHNRVLDDIFKARRTIRMFKPDVPPRELIGQVIQAGLLAPYSGIAVSGKDYRRFVVISRGSRATTRVAEIMKRRAMILCEQLNRQMQQDPFVQQHGQAFARRLKTISQQGVPGIGIAPYYIVVAERKGIPAVEHRSLAHCLQNMWLKATALGLGFQLLSITAEMDEDREFCGLLGIPYGEFALDGCVIGYPGTTPPPIKRPQVDDVTKWID